MSVRGMLALVTALACSLCWGATARGQATLHVGAARVDITPAADPANAPSGKYAHERLYVRAIVLDNGTTRAALIGVHIVGVTIESSTEPFPKIRGHSLPI